MKTVRFLIPIFGAVFFAPSLYACSVCFGDPTSLQSKALSGAVFFLLLMIGGILATIVSLAVKWSRRAKALSQSAG